jgi:hypothetical protein
MDARFDRHSQQLGPHGRPATAEPRPHTAAHLTAAASVCGARARANTSRTSSASASESLGSSAAAATTTLGLPVFTARRISRAALSSMSIPMGPCRWRHVLGEPRDQFEGAWRLPRGCSLIIPAGIKEWPLSSDAVTMGRDLARRYRVTPWAIRICVPLAVLVVIAGLVNAGAEAAIPLPIVLGAAWIYAAERCGLVVTPGGIESRMTRRENRFRHPWSDIDSFELADDGAQVAIVMRLRDGSQQRLPSTRGWFWDKTTVEHIFADLKREQAAAGAHLAH